MALKKTLTTHYGFDVANAYQRVEQVTIVRKDQMSFFVRAYVDPNKPFVVEQVIHAPYDIAGSNPIAQAYEHLKTLPEFAGAVDC